MIIGAKEIFKEMILKFGDKQVIVAIEELSELQKELCKNLRGKENASEVAEEIADVYIMLEQMKIWCNISEEEIQDKIEEKLKRTKERYLSGN